MKTDAENALTRVPRTSLVDEVIAALQRMLSGEAWAPGTKLPSEAELGRQLGVGRSTIREALRVLGHLGMVEARSGLGTYVVDRSIPGKQLEYPQTHEKLFELYEFRRAIEIPTARLAAERRTPDEIQSIRSAWDKCSIAVVNDSPDEFARLDYRFHLTIVEASNNQLFADAYRDIEAVFVGSVNLILDLGPLRSMLHFHDGLIDAIARSDVDGAVKAVEENFMETDVRLRMFLKNNGGSSVT